MEIPEAFRDQVDKYKTVTYAKEGNEKGYSIFYFISFFFNVISTHVPQIIQFPILFVSFTPPLFK